MIQHHNWSLTELDNMIPYAEMLSNWVEEENERIEKEQQNQKRY